MKASARFRAPWRPLIPPSPSASIRGRHMHQHQDQHGSRPPPPPGQTSGAADPTELEHFSALAATWWDPHGPSRLLHLMNPLRLDFLARCRASVPRASSPSFAPSSEEASRRSVSPSSTSPSPSPLPLSPRALPAAHRHGLHILDVGCGGGIFAESAARLAGTAHVTGLDPAAAVVAAARLHARRDPALAGKLEYVEGEVETFAARRRQYETEKAGQEGLGNKKAQGLKEGRKEEGEEEKRGARDEKEKANREVAGGGKEVRQYDVVTLFEVLEHVPNPRAFLVDLCRLVRPGGWLIGSTISRSSVSWMTTKLVAEYILRIVPPGTHDWRKYVRPDELQNLLALTASDGGGRGGGSSAADSWDMGSFMTMGVAFVPGLGWKEIAGSAALGNYFFGVRKVG